jgi:hypothetical protein
MELLRTLQDEMRVLCQEAGARCHFLVDGDDPLLTEAVQALPTPPTLLQRAQWSSNGEGTLLRSSQRTYHVVRELVGESERLSVQAAVLLAEQWTALKAEEIERFLAGEEGETHETPNLQ